MTSKEVKLMPIEESALLFLRMIWRKRETFEKKLWEHEYHEGMTDLLLPWKCFQSHGTVVLIHITSTKVQLSPDPRHWKWTHCLPCLAYWHPLPPSFLPLIWYWSLAEQHLLPSGYIAFIRIRLAFWDFLLTEELALASTVYPEFLVMHSFPVPLPECQVSQIKAKLN